VSCHPEDWSISVTELVKLAKDTQPINEVSLSKVVAAVSALKSGRYIQTASIAIMFAPAKTFAAVWNKNLGCLWRPYLASKTA
jgi:hypothetical protein